MAKKKVKKKTAKKKAPKKKAVKKKATRKATIATKPGEVKVTIYKKVYGKTPEEQTFVLRDDRKLQSIFELVDELETMADEEFKHHVNEVRNDFANWIGDVFDEKHLAKEIGKMHDRMDTQRAILKHIARDLKKLVKHK